MQGNGSLSFSPGSGSTQTVAGTIADQTGSGGTGGSWGIVKSGAGVLMLTGANSFTGDSTLNAGTVQIGAANNLGGGGVQFAGGALETTAGSFPLGQTVRLNAGGASFQTDASVNLTLDQAISGTGGLTKSAPGTLTLATANADYTGGTTVNTGTLVLTGSLQTDALRVSLGATFAMNGATAAFTGTVTDGDTFEAVSGKATFGGGFTNNGALVTDPTSLAFSNLSVGTSGFIQAASGDLYAVSGNVINQSQDGKDWNTRSATLEFVTGATTTHNLSLAAADGGVTLVQIDAGNQLQ